MWKYTGQERPPFAESPAEGQESVWDYPRPPRLEEDTRTVEVRLGDLRIASSGEAFRILETASPPTFYVPPEDVDLDQLERVSGRSFCEWKGNATYWGLKGRPDLGPVGWSYEQPSASYRAIKDYLAFYPARVECYVDGERVQPQASGFYGGWITSELVGPFKGDPGTGGW